MKAARISGLGFLLPLRADFSAAICGLTATMVCCAQFPTPDSFDPEAIGDYNPYLGGQQSSLVSSLAVQPDGKVLVSGGFVQLGGLPCTNFARLNPDGSVDTSFFLESQMGVGCLAVQPDGKLLVGGNFNALAGQPCTNLARFNSDGTLDAGFVAGETNVVGWLAVQPDGKILVSYGNSWSFFSIQRVNADGSLDTGFNPVLGMTNAIGSGMLLQADGKILISGMVTQYDIPTCTGVVRLNADGSADTNFNPALIGGTSESVNCVAVQADGKILVGGWFTSLGGSAARNLGRLNVDGTVDTNFTANSSGSILTMSLQADGKIVVGGYFTMLDGATNYYLGRLNSDGSLDTSFNPEVSFYPPNGFLFLEPCILDLAIQSDGKVLVGGIFSGLGGQTRICIGRLNSAGPVTNSLTLDGSGITWSRGGESPEVWRTSFDVFTPGAGWASLGAGVRIPGGWQLTGVQLPTNATVRARGYIGAGKGLDWFVETILGPPVLGLSWGAGLPLLNLTGETGQQYDVQFGPSLTASNGWQTLASIVLTNSEQCVTDPDNAEQQRFYRALMNQ